jgi:N-formylglutamate amidohydrolase
MQNLDLVEIIANIEKGICFEASHNGDFYIKIQEYALYVCTAIHNGGRIRDALNQNCLLSKEERYFEEDPFTGDFIQSLPITLIGGDSRYEYDLNRDEENCIYKVAWGKEVWKEKLSEEERLISLSKHRNFYKIIHALISKLEKDFGATVIYDVHSYNYQRHEVTHLFNIGIENIDIKRYNSEISHWKRELSTIKLKKNKTEVSVNHIFYGRGYLLKL